METVATKPTSLDGGGALGGPSPSSPSKGSGYDGGAGLPGGAAHGPAAAAGRARRPGLDPDGLVGRPVPMDGREVGGGGGGGRGRRG